ncbi:uncharacterized protein LOC133203854 [Saccostrea echinata]|uniref:uncharacterized protein LOC133203854 n=1 Tax=Saccostrea echinata TaxID=191078 RepID=UPI002A825EC9|nr:uncharacterized protein LOC133203854 [Saccostrea echinata]
MAALHQLLFSTLVATTISLSLTTDQKSEIPLMVVCANQSSDQEMNNLRQQLNQETVIRLSLTKQMYSLVDDMITMKKHMTKMEAKVQEMEKKEDDLQRANQRLQSELDQLLKMNDTDDETSTQIGRTQQDLCNWSSSVDVVCNGTNTALTKSGGAIYTRWGRNECPENETELVYQGFVGGSFFSHRGGSVNYACLPYDPTWGKYNDVLNNDNQNLHAVEYAGNSINISGTPFDEQLRGHGVPCAVCRSTKRRSVLRIPGRNKCYNSWHLEYAGYLMADKFTHESATEYACVDERPEKTKTGPVSKGGKYFYPVEAHCGFSLQCPPYVHGREITCAICTK